MSLLYHRESLSIKPLDNSTRCCFGGRIAATRNDNMIELVERWQSVLPFTPKDLYICVFVFRGSPVSLTFNGMYLGPLPKLLKLVNEIFREMGLVTTDCNETNWMGSVISTAMANGYSTNLILGLQSTQ
ncbi:hypothetical protein SUGI_0571950 [Cryptomeria japonica]|nr:hypothetical protein SUGI_0571950 [Cryptomeria japonica]